MKAPHDQLTAENVATLLGEAAEFGDAEISEYLNEIRSFAGDGVMTRDAGFTIRLADGSEFQVTVIQSRGTNPDYLPEDGTLVNPDDTDPDGRNDPDAFLDAEFLAQRVRTPDGAGTCIQYDRAHNHGAVDLDEGGTWQGSGDDIQLESEWRAEMESIDATGFGHDGSTRPAHGHNDICADCDKICAGRELDHYERCPRCAEAWAMESPENNQHDSGR